MKKYLWLLLCIPLLVTGCKRIPKLADGKEVVVELGGKQFTAEEFYTAMKEENGASVLINMVDKYITEQELTDDMKKDAETEAAAQLNYYKALYSSNWDSFLSYNGFNSDDELKSQLTTMIKQNLVLEKYVKENVVTEKDIQEYYDENINGEMTVRHILITPDVTDEMTEAEKTEAKNKALESAKAIITQLKASQNLSEDFIAIAKEKSDDTGTASQGGLIENITNESGLVEEFYDASLSLAIGAITNEPIETAYGYHVIYKVSQNEKPSLDSVKDNVTTKVATTLLSAENATYVYWAGLREKHNMNIVDDIIKNDYEAAMKNLQK